MAARCSTPSLRWRRYRRHSRSSFQVTIAEDIEKGAEKARKFWAALRQYLGLIVVVSGSVAGVLKWYHETYPPTEPVTTIEMDQRFDQLESSMIAFAQRDSAYRDSLSDERAWYDSTYLRPSLAALADLQRRTGRLEARLVMTNLAIEESRRDGAQTSEQLIRSIARQSSAESRAKEQEKQRDQEQRDKDRALMLAIAKKLKIETKEF